MRAGTILREHSGIPAAPTEEGSYSENLRQFLLSKRNALATGDLSAAGHAGRAAAECLRRLGRLDASEEEYSTAATFFAASHDILGQAWTLFGLGSLYRQRSELRRSIATLEVALDLGRLARNEGLCSYVLAGLAETTRIGGNYSRSCDQHLRAYALFRSMGDARGAIWALEGVGQMLRHNGQPAAALHHFDKAKKLATEHHDRRGLAYARKCRAECLSDLGHHSTALDEAEIAKGLFEAMGFRVGIAYALKALGDVHKASGRLEDAYASFLNARAQFRAVGDSRGIAYTLCSVAGLYVDAGDADAAEAVWSITSAFFEAAEVRLGLGKSRRALASLRRRRGRITPRAERLLDSRNSPEQPSETLEYCVSVVMGIDAACRPLGVPWLFDGDSTPTRQQRRMVSSGGALR